MKKIISILLIIAMVFCFAACAKKKTKVADTDTADASQTTTVGADDPQDGSTAADTTRRARGNVYEGTSKEEAEKCIEYAQKYLDCLYHAKFDGVENGEDKYNDNLESLKDLLFTNTFGDPEYVTDEQDEQYFEIIKTYIDKADYSFEIEENEDGTFSAVVNVNAIHLLADSKDEIAAYREEWHKRYDALTDEELNSRTEEQWTADYVESTNNIITILKNKLGGVTEAATPMSLYITLDETSDSGLSMENAELNNYIVGLTQ